MGKLKDKLSKEKRRRKEAERLLKWERESNVWRTRQIDDMRNRLLKDENEPLGINAPIVPPSSEPASPSSWTLTILGGDDRYGPHPSSISRQPSPSSVMKKEIIDYIEDKGPQMQQDIINAMVDCWINEWICVADKQILRKRGEYAQALQDLIESGELFLDPIDAMVSIQLSKEEINASDDPDQANIRTAVASFSEAASSGGVTTVNPAYAENIATWLKRLLQSD